MAEDSGKQHWPAYRPFHHDPRGNSIRRPEHPILYRTWPRPLIHGTGPNSADAQFNLELIKGLKAGIFGSIIGTAATMIITRTSTPDASLYNDQYPGGGYATKDPPSSLIIRCKGAIAPLRQALFFLPVPAFPSRSRAQRIVVRHPESLRARPPSAERKNLGCAGDQ